MTTNEQLIHATHDRWIAAVNAGDLPTLLALVTDDVVFLNPGQPPLNKAEFEAHFNSATGRARIQCTSELDEVVVERSMAYARSHDSVSVTLADSDETNTFTGDRITIYRQQADGRWLLARDIHTVS